MVFLRFLVIMIILYIQKNYIYSCPNQLAYYQILSKANWYYENKSFFQAMEEYKKIEECEQFYNTEKNLFQYSLSIILYCKENDFVYKGCMNDFIKAKNLLKASIKMLAPETFYKKELSIRYYYLGFVFLKLNRCNQAKNYYLKSYKIYPNEEALKNYNTLEAICKNG